MPDSLHLIPTPRKLRTLPGQFRLPTEMFIVLSEHPATAPLFPAERFILDAEPLTGTQFRLSMGEGVAPEREIRVRFDEALFAKLPAEIRGQAYRLSVSTRGITITAAGAPGVFYAFQTLLQIIRESAYGNAKPKTQNSKPKSPRTTERAFALECAEIVDYPDFARRGFYHDTARGKVPTVDTLLELIDDLGHLKYNEFQLYIENNFQFRRFPEMYDDTDPFTAEELLILDAACRARRIDFVPSLTSLGHFEKILCRPAFRHLAEAQPKQLKAMKATCWHEAGPWSLAVADPKARKLLRDMYAEFAPNFSSRQFNICCDEAYDLGTVRSRKLAQSRGGTGPLYADWIDYCAGLTKGHGKSIQMWGDIILHHPDLIARLPADATLLEWGYEHDHKFTEHCAIFQERLQSAPPGKTAARHFYVCPGTSSWLALSSRSKNAFGNIHAAAAAGLQVGASGVLVTEWGDNGHQQPLAVSVAAVGYGAAAAWNLSATPDPYETDAETRRRGDAAKKGLETRNSKLETFLVAASLHLFADPAGQLAGLAYDLGLTYERFSWQRFNGSLDWFLFREKWDFANYVNRAETADFPRDRRLPPDYPRPPQTSPAPPRWKTNHRRADFFRAADHPHLRANRPAKGMDRRGTASAATRSMKRCAPCRRARCPKISPSAWPACTAKSSP